MENFHVPSTSVERLCVSKKTCGKVKMLTRLVDGQHLRLPEITPTTTASWGAVYKAGGTGLEEPVPIVPSGKRTEQLQTSTSNL